MLPREIVRPREIREMMDRLGLTQEELAELLDPPVSHTTVSRWLRGAVPYPKHAVQLRRLMGRPEPVADLVIEDAVANDPDATPEQRTAHLRSKQAWDITQREGLGVLTGWWAMRAQWACLDERISAEEWMRHEGNTPERAAKLAIAVASLRRLGIWPWRDD